MRFCGLGPVLLLLAAVMACPVSSQAWGSGDTNSQGDPVTYVPRHGNLTANELNMAKTAWRYFENNYQPNTGLVNAVEAYPSSSIWDTASYIAALIAAHELGLIDQKTFDARMKLLLKTLAGLPLFNNELPNKAYNTMTAQMVNYANQPGAIGFSALDIGRMLIWLDIIHQRYPEYDDLVTAVVQRWDFSHALGHCGLLFGAVVDGQGHPHYVQEGRLGYEEYAAKGFELWGGGTCRAATPRPFQTIPMYCVEVPYDSRDPRRFLQHNYVVSESYVLEGIEFGWDDPPASGGSRTISWEHNFADRIYQVQENRYKETGIFTARSEHQLDQAPYFVYDTIYSDGFPWNTITDQGQYVPQFAAVGTKAALGLWVLWDSPYTQKLAEYIWNQFLPDKGYYEGVLENGKGPIRIFTANNNGIMLEALLFKQQGMLLHTEGGAAAPHLLKIKSASPLNTCPQTGSGSALKSCSTQMACAQCPDNTPVALPAWSSSCH